MTRPRKIRHHVFHWRMNRHMRRMGFEGIARDGSTGAAPAKRRHRHIPAESLEKVSAFLEMMEENVVTFFTEAVPSLL